MPELVRVLGRHLNELRQGYRADPDKRFYLYNSNRPGSGSFAIKDEAVALRGLARGWYKMGVDRWIYWEST